jgi:exodeoxyribonuclease VII large subunit
VSSEYAAGYQDFIKQIHGNMSGYCFCVELFAATMQGSNAAQSMIMALESIKLRSTKFDVVAILRGGGAQSDLNCFDEYEIAATIANFPLPIITGIGHDKDISICDMCAHTMTKTPTAAAEFLLAKFAAKDNYFVHLHKKLEFINNKYINNRYKHLERCKQKINILSLKYFNAKKDKIIRYLPLHINTTIAKIFAKKNNNLEQLHLRIAASDPMHVLRRGYSITRLSGKTLTAAQDIKVGSIITTTLADGFLVDSFVVDIRKPDTK